VCVWVWVLIFSHKPSTRLINLDIAHIGRRACEEMVKKKRVLIYANSEIHEKAKELGFNISKLCENAMKESIDRLSAPHYQEKIKFPRNPWCGEWDSNPRRPSPQEPQSCSLDHARISPRI
jgi:post-segregation antitoxin (ccd killing protein)